MPFILPCCCSALFLFVHDGRQCSRFAIVAGRRLRGVVFGFALCPALALFFSLLPSPAKLQRNQQGEWWLERHAYESSSSSSTLVRQQAAAAAVIAASYTHKRNTEAHHFHAFFSVPSSLLFRSLWPAFLPARPSASPGSLFPSSCCCPSAPPPPLALSDKHIRPQSSHPAVQSKHTRTSSK